MKEKIKTLKNTVPMFLSDVRNIGLLIFVLIALLVTWSGVKVVQTNYDLQKQISVMRQENDVKRLANANIELSNQYLQTDHYLELVARKQFNKALPGEKLLIIPRTVAESHTVEVPLRQQDDEPQIEAAGPWYERNFNAWLDFLFRK